MPAGPGQLRDKRLITFFGLGVCLRLLCIGFLRVGWFACWRGGGGLREAGCCDTEHQKRVEGGSMFHGL